MVETTQEVVFSIVHLEKAFGSRTILNGISLSFLRGARIGVIGPNGQGKSTLLRIMSGADTEYAGDVVPANGLTVGYVPQEPHLDQELTVGENVAKGVARIRAMLHEYEDISAKLADGPDEDTMNALLDKMTRLQERIEACDGWELDRHVEQAMMALRCPPSDRKIATLSGGEKRRVALCQKLLEHPDLLLLDEPTNHLDADTVAWLEKHLQNYNGSIILVTHDRYFLDNVVGWMLEIERGGARPYKGNYSEYLRQREEYYRQQQKAEDSRAKILASELEWIRQNPKGRTTKSQARVNRYEELLAQSKELVRDDVQIRIPFTRRLGSKVISVRDVSKTYDGRLLFSNLSFELPPGAILGVMGPNGTGKTTLMRMITGQEKPDTGAVEIGETVDLCYLDQSRDSLKPDSNVYDEVTGGKDVLVTGGREINGRAYLASFNFRGTDQSKRVGDLSGGERNRLLMAKMLVRGGNVLLLDEPTNDLDLATLRVLEEALLAFPGCAIVVTHDRFFLDRIATHILSFEGDGKVVFFNGNYQQYAEHRQRQREEQGLGNEPKGAHRKFRGS
ncbi:MAG: energy-dependent translational throttle protein EttA [Planctomycetes bacterium]|nr:energy-dependent translational throttle protein EttA [Planctomycetota bacterium]